VKTYTSVHLSTNFIGKDFRELLSVERNISEVSSLSPLMKGEGAYSVDVNLGISSFGSLSHSEGEGRDVTI